MNRTTASALAMGTVTIAAIAAAMVSANAFADDITIDPTPFVSTRTRAEVQAELMKPGALVRDEWALQDNHVPQLKSGYTSEQAKAEYRGLRQYVRAVTGEDSGSAFFIKSGGASRVTGTMGGPAR